MHLCRCKQIKYSFLNKLSIPFCLFRQAIERGPAQLNPAADEQEESGEGAQQSISEVDNMEVRGSRFSKSAEERQNMLKQRKEEMLQQARRFVHRCGMFRPWKILCESPERTV